MLRKVLKQIVKIAIVLLLSFCFIESCPIALQDGWRQTPVEERAKSSSVVAVGKAIVVRVDESLARRTKFGDFQLLEVLKGRNITDQINALGGSLFRIHGFGSPVQCLSPVSEGVTYLLFEILEPQTVSLVAAMVSPFSATAVPTRANRDRILASLGMKY